MNMVNILKLRDGRKVSRDEYAQAKQRYEDLYSKADADTKAKMDGLMASSLNFSSANPMNNRSTREYQTQLYTNAANYMENGTMVSGSPGVGTANMFNGYSHIENEGNANNVFSRYMSHANGPAKGTASAAGSATSTAPASSTGGYGDYYRYNGMKGIDADWTTDNDTLDDRIDFFANTLKENISAALNSGKKIVGASADQLQQALNDLEAGGWKGNFKALAAIARKAGVDPSGFKTFFNGFIPGQDLKTKNRKAREAEGWQFTEGGDYGEGMNKYIADNGYIVGTKDGKTYIMNSDFSGPVTGKAGAFVNTDYSDPTKEGQGWAVNDEGQFTFGDMGQILNDQNNPFYAAVDNYLKGQANDQRWKYNPREFNQFGSTSKIGLINRYAQDLHKKKFVDLSKYFDGKKVIATVEGDNFNAYKSKFGHLKLNDPNFHFYYEDKNGKFKEGNLGQLEAVLGKVNLNSTSNLLGLDDYQSKDYNLGGLQSLDESTIKNKDINGESGFHNWLSKNIEMKNGWSGETLDTDHALNSSYGPNENKPDKFVRLLLYIRGNWEDLIRRDDREARQMVKTYEYWLGSENPERRAGTIRLIWERMENHPEGFRTNYENYRDAFQMIINANTGLLAGSTPSTEPVQTDKNGGVLKAAQGTAIDASGKTIQDDGYESYARSVRDRGNRVTEEQNRTYERAKANGRSVKQQREIQRNEWTAADTTRAIALAGDVSGLIAAIAAPGAGSAYAVGEGVVSTLMDLGADIADDKVSTGQALKNFGINAGLTAGAMFGAKAPKIIKGITTILPKAMTVLGTAGIVLDPEIQKTVDKVTSGKDLNVNDWKNIVVALRMATGLGTMTATRVQGHKGKKEYAKLVDENIKKTAANSEAKKGIKQAFDGKDVIEVEEGRFNAAAAELKKGNTDENVQKAVQILTEEKDGKAGITPEQANGIIERISGKKPITDRLKFWKKEETAPEGGSAKLREVTPEMAEKAHIGVPDETIAQARLNAISQMREKHGNTWKWMKPLGASNTFQERFNPYMNSPLATVYEKTGKQYGTIGDYESELRTAAKSAESTAKSPTSSVRSKAKANIEKTTTPKKEQSTQLPKSAKPNTSKEPTVKSYTNIRNRQQAKETALKGRTDYDILSSDKVMQLKRHKKIAKEVRGAAIDHKTNELVVWKKGGEMKVDYNKLRK